MGEGTNDAGGYIAAGGGYDTDYQQVNALLPAALAGFNVFFADHGANPDIGPVPPIGGDFWHPVDGVAPNRVCVHWNDNGQLVAAPITRAQLGFS